MNSLLFLIPLSILLLVGAGIALFWAVDHGQFEDMDTPGLLPLVDNAPEPTDPAPGIASNASSNEVARPLP
ncbi:MAG: cbb3-type cytochrome oxidase assembly protein CcoS [Casimicrobiaceae bacterium]